MQVSTLKALSWGGAILYFGIPALLMVFGFYVLMPFFIRRGMTEYYAYSLGLGIPLFLLLIAALVGYRLEGHPLDWASLTERFRYAPMKPSDWLWTGGIFAAAVLVNTQFARITRAAIDRGLIPLPDNLPAFVDPRTVFSTETLDAAVGGLAGNWPVLVISVLLLIVNVLGEELWWRGLIFPRQQVTFGQWAWVIHGVMWALFHAYKYWDLFSLLPMTLGLSFLIYHTRNNTTGLVMHFVGNGSGLLPILLGILSMG